MITIAHAKGTHVFRLRFDIADECQALAAIVDWVHNASVPFDWLDAGVLFLQVRQAVTASPPPTFKGAGFKGL